MDKDSSLKIVFLEHCVDPKSSTSSQNNDRAEQIEQTEEDQTNFVSDVSSY